MRKYLILFFSAMLFLCACDGNSAPAGIIKPKQMIALLTQIHIVDGYLYDGKLDPDSSYKYGTARYLYVFKQFHTDSAQFKKSMKYYTTDLTQLSAMYDEIGRRIDEKADSLAAALAKQSMLQHKKDSINNAHSQKLDTIHNQAIRRQNMVQGAMRARHDSIERLRSLRK